MAGKKNNLHLNFGIAHKHNLELSAKIATGEIVPPPLSNRDFFLYYSLVDRLCLDDGAAVETVIAYICQCDISPGRNNFDAVCRESNSAIELKTNHITIHDFDALEEAKVLQLQLNNTEDKIARQKLKSKIKQLSNNKKFTMRGVFSDLTRNSWVKYKTSKNALMHVALMLNERLIAVIEFPIKWKTFAACIEDQLNRCAKDASFSPTHYGDCPALKARWILTPDKLQQIKFLFSANNFALVLRLAEQYHEK